MAFDTTNIIVGAANVFIGPTAPATPVRPTIPTITTGTLLAGWKHIGFTSEGVEVSYEPDYGDVEVDQLMDSARIFKQGMRVTVNTTMAEASLENLLVAWGQNITGATTTPVVLGSGDIPTVDILGGRLGEAPVERQLFFAGPRGGTAAATGERQYHLWRAVQTESTSFALRRAESTALPTSFRCLPRAGASSGGPAYGSITDVATRAFLDFGG